MTGPASLLVTRLEAFAPDIVFNLAEGHRGKTRRAFYPALFEELGIPSTGSDAYTLCVTLDKALTKKQLAGCGVPSPRGRFVTRASLRGGGLDELPFPVIVKPNFEGSSARASARTASSRIPSRSGACSTSSSLKYPDGVLVERYVPGVDVRVVLRRGARRAPRRRWRRSSTRATRGASTSSTTASRTSTRASSSAGRRRGSPAGVHRAPARSGRSHALAPSACATSRRSTSGWAPTARSTFLSTTAHPELRPGDGALFAATQAVGRRLRRDGPRGPARRPRRRTA